MRSYQRSYTHRRSRHQRAESSWVLETTKGSSCHHNYSMHRCNHSRMGPNKPCKLKCSIYWMPPLLISWQNGANLTWPHQLKLTTLDGPPTETGAIWKFAAINASLYLSASLLGCWLSDPLQSLILGRRGAIFFSACLCLAGSIGSGFSRTWRQLLGCRIVLGAAMGAKASVTPIYGAEISPSHLR